MIDGVVVKDITRYYDDRGFFNEIGRFVDLEFPVAQANHGMRYVTVGNGWHIHQYLDEIFYVVTGAMRVVLKDCRIAKPTKTEFIYREPQRIFMVNYGLSMTPNEYQEIVVSWLIPKIIRIPTGVAHGYRILAGDCHMIYFESQDYSITRNDEGRIESDRWPEHDWMREIQVK